MVVHRLGSSHRERPEAFVATRGINVQRTLEFGTVDGILGCVAAGIGITLLPHSVVRSAADEARVAGLRPATSSPDRGLMAAA